MRRKGGPCALWNRIFKGLYVLGVFLETGACLGALVEPTPMELCAFPDLLGIESTLIFRFRGSAWLEALGD